MNRFKTNALLQILMFLLACGALLFCVTTVVEAKIVFKSERGENYEIYVMDDDGSNVQRLTNHRDDGRVLIDGSPAWSPDGTHIAFDRIRLASKTNRRIEQSEIFLMNSTVKCTAEYHRPRICNRMACGLVP